MSGKVLTRHMLICDGCGATLGQNGEYANAAESRAAAARKGWTIVPKLRSNGKPAAAQSHDVCPACQPTFKPSVIRNSGNVYWQELKEENRRLHEELRTAREAR